MSWLAFGRVLTLTAALIPAACRPVHAPPSAPHGLLQVTLPDFARPTLADALLDTAALRGKVVVVKFFAKWCEPCRRTLPEYERLHRQSAGEIAFIGISEDERIADALAVVEQFGLSFPVVIDRGNVLAGRFRVHEMPMTFVADRRGVIQWIGGPEQGETDLAAAIASIAR